MQQQQYNFSIGGKLIPMGEMLVNTISVELRARGETFTHLYPPHDQLARQPSPTLVFRCHGIRSPLVSSLSCTLPE